MNHEKFSKQLLTFGLILLFLVGCSTPATPTTIPTPIPPTPTQTKTPIPTDSPTITPTYTNVPETASASVADAIIKGKFLLLNTGKGVPSATVRLFQGDQIIDETTTDSDGNYSLTGAKSGSAYDMTFNWATLNTSTWPCSSVPPAGQISFSTSLTANSTAGEEWFVVVYNENNSRDLQPGFGILSQGKVKIDSAGELLLDIEVKC